MTDRPVYVDKLLAKGEKQYSGLEKAVKEALRKQDPAEYQRRYPEEFPAEQNAKATSERNLLPELAAQVAQTQRIDFDSWPQVKDQGFTIGAAMLWVIALTIGIPLVIVFWVSGDFGLLALAFLGMLLLAFQAGKWSQRAKGKAGE